MSPSRSALRQLFSGDKHHQRPDSAVALIARHELDAEAVAMFASAVRAHLAAGGAALIATHIDLGLAEARLLDLSACRAAPLAADDFDGAFL